MIGGREDPPPKLLPLDIGEPLELLDDIVPNPLPPPEPLLLPFTPIVPGVRPLLSGVEEPSESAPEASEVEPDLGRCCVRPKLLSVRPPA